MKAIWIKKSGGPEVLEVRETPDPEPKEGEIRIRSHAAGLNFAEVQARQGLYPDAPKPPCIVGYEGAGVVEKLGAGVTGPAVGTRVLFLSRFGAHADVVCAPAAQVIPIPDALSFEHAAALPVNYLTAYQMLVQIGRVRAGDRVLIHMAAGGVGIAALQMCRAIGGVETFGTASASKHDVIRGHGCQHPIDYRTKDYVAEVKALTQGEGVDFILDPLGGADWSKGYGLLRAGGLLFCFGMANIATPGRANYFRAVKTLWQVPTFKPMNLMNDNKGVVGVNLGHLWHRPDLVRRGLSEVVAMWERKEIAPHIDGVFPFEKAADAFGRLEHGKNVGKVILTP